MIKLKRHKGMKRNNTVMFHTWFELTIWLSKAEFHRSDTNRHGSEYSIRTKGWSLINLKRANGNRGTGHAYRVIKYWSNGAWWHLDLKWNRKYDK